MSDYLRPRDEDEGLSYWQREEIKRNQEAALNAEMTRLHDLSAEQGKRIATLVRQLAEANETIEALKGRCRDMYANDDGEAWSETESYFESKGWDISLPAQQENQNERD